MLQFFLYLVLYVLQTPNVLVQMHLMERALLEKNAQIMGVLLLERVQINWEFVVHVRNNIIIMNSLARFNI